MKNKEVAKEICKTLGGFFGRDNIWVGGSLSLELKFPKFKQDYNSDIDIFISTKRIESWALLHTLEILSSIDIEIYENRIREKFPDYKLRGQWKRIIGLYLPTETKVDLIFVDTNINTLIEDTAADISKFYYKLNYKSNFNLVSSKSGIARTNIINGKCAINVMQANAKHIAKTNERCNNFGLKLVRREFVPK